MKNIKKKTYILFLKKKLNKDKREKIKQILPLIKIAKYKRLIQKQISLFFILF